MNGLTLTWSVSTAPVSVRLLFSFDIFFDKKVLLVLVAILFGAFMSFLLPQERSDEDLRVLAGLGLITFLAQAGQLSRRYSNPPLIFFMMAVTSAFPVQFALKFNNGLLLNVAVLWVFATFALVLVISMCQVLMCRYFVASISTRCHNHAELFVLARKLSWVCVAIVASLFFGGMLCLNIFGLSWVSFFGVLLAQVILGLVVWVFIIQKLDVDDPTFYPTSRSHDALDGTYVQSRNRA